MFLYANGCSWVEGNGIESDPSLTIIDNSVKFYWNKFSWPARLAELMNWNYINDGVGAGSNQRMVRMTTEFVKNWPKELLDNLVVILGWSSLERGEILISYDNKKQWCNFNMMQQFSSQWNVSNPSPYPKHVLDEIDACQRTHMKYMSHDDYYLSKFNQEIYTLAKTLEQLNVKYLFFSSFLNYKSSYNMESQVPAKFDFLSNPKFMNILNYSMLNFCNENKLAISPCHHPMIDAHYHWAKKLKTEYNKIYK